MNMNANVSLGQSVRSNLIHASNIHDLLQEILNGACKAIQIAASKIDHCNFIVGHY
jgi:hypothetical protein